jgi:hypothetical protein
MVPSSFTRRMYADDTNPVLNFTPINNVLGQKAI